MEPANFWHLWTNRYFSLGLISQHSTISLHFLLFTSATAFSDVSPQVFSGIKLQALGAGPLHNFNFIGLERRCCLLTGVFEVVVLPEHPFGRRFLFGMRRRDLLKYFDMGKLIRAPLYAIHRPNEIGRESPHHDACTAAMLHWGFNTVLCGALTNCLRPLWTQKKEQCYFHQCTEWFSSSL